MVETVSVALAVPLATGVTEVKLKPQETVAFTGAMAQLNPTAALKPPSEVTVMVELVEFPARVVAATGDEAKVKLLTVNE